MPITFLKKGKEAHQAFVEAEKQAEARAAARGALRFWTKEGEDKMITFLDGELDDGVLEAGVTFNQHNVKINGKFRNYFVCVAEHEPCPLCQMDNYATLVCCFTVIDHSKYTDRNGKVHQHERKLFVAKRDTMKRLQKLAAKRGGLTGWTVSVSRIGDKSPEVGTDFDFVERQDLDELRDALKLKPEGVQPLDYEKEIKILSADQLRELGFGAAVIGQSDTSLVLGKKKAKKAEVEDEDDEDEAPAKKQSLFGAKKSEDKPKKSKLFGGKAKAAADDDDDDSPPFTVGKKAKAKPVVEDDDVEDADDDADDM